MGKIKSTGAKALLECLRREGVDTIFGYPGGAVIPLYDELFHCEFIKHILVRHEQGAGHMAEGFAHATGKVGVCLATSGPGATNLVTPIADAMMDSIPMVAITGQVRTEVIGKDAFQEVDITGVTMPITKHNWLIKDVNDLPRIVHEAFHVARSGRPGPVLIDVPVDVSRAVIEYDPDEAQKVSIKSFKSEFKVHPQQVKRAAELIAEAKKPVLYVGGGAKAAGAHDEILALAERVGIPVTTTLHGLGTFPENHALSLGMLGMHGTAYANHAVHNCDLLIAVGARFDDRVTGKVSAFAPDAKIIHIDIDPGEINKVKRADVSIVGDCRAALTEVLNIVQPRTDLTSWQAETGVWKTDFPLEAPNGSEDGQMHSEHVIREIARLTDRKVVVTTDVGQHQMWSAQHFGMRSPRQFITSGGAGTMGFGLPAAIGAQFGVPDAQVWCISGDGSIQMCSQELMTARVYGLPIKIAILNNQFLGMVRQWQEMFWQKHYSHVNLEQAPDFIKLAEAYDCVGLRCERVEDIEATVARAMEINDRPVVIDFRVAKETNVYPMIPSGQTIHDMVTTKPAKAEQEPVNTCHISPSVVAEGMALDAEADNSDSRLPKPGEVVDVAR